MSIFGAVAAPSLGTDSVNHLRHHLPGLVALAAASCLAVTTEMLPVGLLPAIGDAFRVSASVTGLLVTLYAVMVATLAVPLTIVTARFGRKPLLLSTLAGYVVCNALVAVAPSFAVVAVGRTIGGISHALFFSLCIGYAPRLVAARDVGRALAIAGSGVSAGFVLGVPLSTSLGTALGWRWSFGVLAAAAVMVLAVVARTLPRVSNERPAESGTGRRSRLVAVGAANVLTWIGQFIVYTFVTVLLLSAGLAPGLVGPWLLAFGACGIVGLFCTARTLDSATRWTAVAVLVCVLGGLLGVAVAFPVLTWVLVAAGVWNGAFGGMASVYQTCAVRTHAVSPEMAGAWINATANVGIAGGAAIGAVLLDAVGVADLPWAAMGPIAAALVIVLTARGAFPSRPDRVSA
jgi:predicted MFS family arabinose efflux permease